MLKGNITLDNCFSEGILFMNLDFNFITIKHYRDLINKA